MRKLHEGRAARNFAKASLPDGEPPKISAVGQRLTHAIEHRISTVKLMFGDQQLLALSDYIEAALMLKLTSARWAERATARYKRATAHWEARVRQGRGRSAACMQTECCLLSTLCMHAPAGETGEKTPSFWKKLRESCGTRCES